MKTIFTLLVIGYVVGVVAPLPVMPQVNSIVGTTSDPEARAHFKQGLLLLHNFEYADAADQFRKARQEDPSFALAYWGEAMTHNHPIWLSQDRDEARRILARYTGADRTQNQKLPALDADLLRSLEILYGEGTKEERDRKYATFMADLFERHPENHDVAAFYALSLLGQAAGWDEELCNRAAAIAGSVLKKSPDHPGALHYYIHAEDHPEFARYAWDQANAYGKVASYSGHALHMPSHIYLALGVWDEVVRSNEISWKAAVDRKAERDLTNNALNYHAHWWLAYGYLQQGRYQKAREIVRAQLAFTRELPSAAARTHLVLMRGHYLVETNDWESDLLSEEIKVSDLRVEIRCVDKFVRALNAFRKGDRAQMGTLVTAMEGDVRQARQLQNFGEGITQCSAVPYGAAGIFQASILLEELKALQAYMEGDLVSAETHFRNATALEDKSGHFFGPPEILKPSYEFLGEFLLEKGEYARAIQSFDVALRKSPGRTQALHDLARALARQRDEREGDVKRSLQQNLRKGDAVEVRGFFPVR